MNHSNFNLERLVRPNILNLQPYSSARDEFSADFDTQEGTFLDANENPFGVFNRYPDPQQKTLKARLGAVKNIAPDHIFIGNGSDEVIDLVFRIFCNPQKDKALTFSPTYGMYEVSANINDVSLVKIPLTADFQIDFDTLQPYLKDEHLKVIFICSPNNPTANMLNDITPILEQFGGIVVIDEAYIDFAESPSWIEKINEYPNLIVSQTFSKAWGQAALRVGVAYAQKGIIGLMNKVKPPYNISLPNQQNALHALDNIALFETQKATILAQRTWLQNALRELKIVKKIYPSDANFLLIETENADAVYEYLVTKKVVVRNRHKVIPNCLRITVGSETENQRLVAALENVPNPKGQGY